VFGSKRLLLFAAWLHGTGFACGEFLSFASPKERNQRKGDPGSLESPEICLDFEATAQTRGSLTSNRSNSAQS
jgi:hypothetical protein